MGLASSGHDQAAFICFLLATALSIVSSVQQVVKEKLSIEKQKSLTYTLQA